MTPIDDTIPDRIPIGRQPSIPASSGSGVTRDIPDGFPIGQRPSAPCAHDFVFLREQFKDHSAEKVDVFYCRHCLEQRAVNRSR